MTALIRLGGVLALAIATMYFAAAPFGLAAQSVLHLPNLVFHEAGHVLFGILGTFMRVLGGSLFQVLVPIICAVAFMRQANQFAAAICVWWAGQNLVDVAPYIADARRLDLVLLGGATGAEVEGHDWEFLLTQLGWLHLDQTIGVAVHRIGLLVMTGALLWAGLILWRGTRA